MPLKDMLDNHKRVCKLARQIELLPDDDRLTLSQWLEELPAYRVAHLMTQYGYPLSETTVVKHLRKVCLCYHTM